MTFKLSPTARDWLSEHGFDTILGARPMKRLIQKEIKDHLADEILFGELKNGRSTPRSSSIWWSESYKTDSGAASGSRQKSSAAGAFE